MTWRIGLLYAGTVLLLLASAAVALGWLRGTPSRSATAPATALAAVVPPAATAERATPVAGGTPLRSASATPARATRTIAPAVVSATASGQGTIAPSGATSYAIGGTATYTATASDGQLFVGWTLDGTYVGYAPTLTFTIGANRALVATFVARPAFADVPPSDPDYRALTTLAALGIVDPQGVGGSGQFRPEDAVSRAEIAAFIARAFGWERQQHAAPFPDRCDPTGGACVDDARWNAVGALADYGVVAGEADAATCEASGTTAPCYLPREDVLRLQVVSLVARAFANGPSAPWSRLAAVAGQYANVPDGGTQRSDLATYRANAGPVPGQTGDAEFPIPTGLASRRFVVEALWQAYDAQFGVDRVP